MKKLYLSMMFSLGATLGYAVEAPEVGTEPTKSADQVETMVKQMQSVKPTALKLVTDSNGGDAAAAYGNENSSKQKGFGQVSVNPLTQQVQIQFNLPSFGGFDLGLSYSSMAGQAAPDASPFALPPGIVINLPYIVKNNGIYTLYIAGSGYYIDRGYSTGIKCEADGDESICDDSFATGLKYQSGKSITFTQAEEDTILSVSVLDSDGNKDKVYYVAKLTYANGNTFYFDEYGKVILATNKYFVSGQKGNSKSALRISYNSSRSGVMNNPITEIVNGDDGRLLFTHTHDGETNRYTMTYPQGPSCYADGFSPDCRSLSASIYMSGDEVNAITTSVSDNYDYGYIIDYQERFPVEIQEGLMRRDDLDMVAAVKGYYFEYGHEKDIGGNYKISGVKTMANTFCSADGSGGSACNDLSASFLGSYKTKFAVVKSDDSDSDQPQYGTDPALDNIRPSSFTKIKTITSSMVDLSDAKSGSGDNSVIVETVYNDLGLPVLERTYTRTGGNEKMISASYTQYHGVASRGQGYDLTPFYNKPYKKWTVAYNADGKPVGINMSTSDYNDYSNETVAQEYPYVSFSSVETPSLKALLTATSKQSVALLTNSNGGIEYPSYPTGIDPLSRQETSYSDYFQAVTKQMSLDCAQGNNKTNCAQAKQTIQDYVVNHFGDITKSTSTFKDLVSGDVGYGKTFEYTYADMDSPCPDSNYNQAGLVCSETVTSPLSENAGKSVTKTYQYNEVTFNDISNHYPVIQKITKRSYQDPTGVTARASILANSNAGEEAQMVETQVGTQTVKTEQIFPTVNIDQSGANAVDMTKLESVLSYNLAGLPILNSNSDGTKSEIEYDFRHMVKTTYLLPVADSKGADGKPLEKLAIEKTYIDPLGNELKVCKPTLDGKWFVSQTNEYDYSFGKPMLYKQTDAYGNYSITTYDNQGRPIRVQSWKVADDAKPQSFQPCN